MLPCRVRILVILQVASVRPGGPGASATYYHYYCIGSNEIEILAMEMSTSVAAELNVLPGYAKPDVQTRPQARQSQGSSQGTISR